MKLTEEYVLMFNAISKTIEELEVILVKANTSINFLKKVQLEAEELVLSKSDNDCETETDD